MRQRAPLAAIARLAARAPRLILAITGALVAVGAVFAVGAPQALSPAGYEVSGSESTRAAQVLEATFDAGAPNVVITARAEAGTLDSPATTQAAQSFTRKLAEIDDVTAIGSYWSTGQPALRSTAGDTAIISARIVADEHTVYDRVEAIRSLAQTHSKPDLDLTVGGSAASNLELVEVSERDLIRAELIVFPITTIMLLVVFRTVVAALLPLIVSVIAVVGTAVLLRALSGVTVVSIFGLNLTTALGLGMAIDYSLFIITRWREERPRCDTAQQAVVRAVEVAGRSVLFSGLTTAATLAALLVFDYPLLRSLAVAGFVVVGLATAGALVALPAAMYLLGDRIDAGRIRAPAPTRPVEQGGWYRLARAVMRRPVAVGGLVVVLLLITASPFLRADFGLPDDRALPSDVGSRAVADAVRADFPAISTGAIAAYWEAGPAAGSDDSAELAERFSNVDGVARVDSASGTWADGVRIADQSDPARYVARDPTSTATWFSITTEADPMTPAAAEVVRDLRAMNVDGLLLVGGEPARLVDNTAEIAAKIPAVLIWIAVVIFALLFMSFASVLVPLKAFLLNLVSLNASFGALVWIFQDGRFSDLLDYTPTGTTDAQTPVLMFCIAFGLSMDYEVFLLARIQEEWRASGDTEHAVAAGLQRTGGIISAAGLLMAVVFLSFATGDVTVIQMVGIGLALAILVDAFIVRTLLVPAFMALAGSWNWWAPGRSSASRGQPARPAATPTGRSVTARSVPGSRGPRVVATVADDVLIVADDVLIDAEADTQAGTTSGIGSS